MVRKQHKILCIVLCLALALSSLLAGTFSAIAASGDTVYVKVNNGWSNVHCYMWSEGTGDNQSWPGVQMTNVSGDVYSYTLTGNYSMIIFNNGSSGSGNQTSDMSYPGNGKIYDLSAGSWSDYSGSQPATSSQDPTTATQATQPATSSSTTGSNTVYLKNSANWSTANCYMWNSANDSNAAWPGVKMTSVGDGVWQYTASKSYANCIFNDGSAQTSDLTAKYGYIYDNSTNQWSVYDTSPLQVKSYSIDPSDGVYTGTEVTLNTTAQSSAGTVLYSFSVTNASGGTSVIAQNKSAGTATWTPVAAGAYTLTFSYADTAGNENSRTISVTVKDDSALASPVIKSVTPANLNLIKVGAVSRISVNAGGGKTGTNLLFYKYVITDPNGVENTPYYTLNSTYNFTPTIEGKYTVDVYVQASDNSDAVRTYTYTATKSDIPVVTDPVVVPTTAPTQPVTVATTPTQVVTTSPVTTQPSGQHAKGDSNGDGDVDIKDATNIQKYLANFDVYIDLDASDVTGDNDVTIRDATEIQRIISH